MPPRKSTRVSQATSPTITKTPEPTSKVTDEDVLNDPWTDEEETGLFKGLIKWKPTGIHKHFRMLQLREYMLENDYIHVRSEHTQIPGIWQKLESLYDLEALDQREDAHQLSDLSETQTEDEEEEAEDDVYSLAANKIHIQPFELPWEEYGEQLWKRRLPTDRGRRDESPPAISGLNLQEQPPVKFTPSFSIEPDEAATPTTRRGKQTKGSARPRVSAASTRRSRRQAEESEEPESEAAASEEQDEDGAESDENQDEEEDDEEEEASQTSVPTTRGRGRGRGRGAPRGRPRGRRKGQ